MEPTAPIQNDRQNGLTSRPTSGSIFTTYRAPLVAVCVLILGIIFLGIFFSKSLSSLPGASDYSLKTELVEKLIGYTKFGATAHASYDITRLERRLTELKALSADAATSSPEVQGVVGTLIDAHIKDALTIVKNSSLSSERRIDTLSKLSDVVNALGVLIESTDELTPMSVQIETSAQNVDDALTESMHTFVTDRSVADVSIYLGTQIEDVSTKITTVAPGSTAQRRAISRISDANEAIIDGHMEEAITYILKARQAISLDSYLFDAERGLGDVTPIEPSEAPLGT